MSHLGRPVMMSRHTIDVVFEVELSNNFCDDDEDTIEVIIRFQDQRHYDETKTIDNFNNIELDSVIVKEGGDWYAEIDGLKPVSTAVTSEQYDSLPLVVAPPAPIESSMSHLLRVL